MGKSYKVSDAQAFLLGQLNARYHQGMQSSLNAPIGMSSLDFSGEGPTFSGLIRRGFVVQRNGVFYITEEGQIALQTWDESQLDS